MNALGILTFFSSILLSLQNQDLKYVWDVVLGKEPYSNLVVPIDTYTVAGQQGRLNPLFDDNDVQYRWIGNSSAFFRNTFLVTKQEFDADRVLLVFEGVDTFATIKVNDHVLGSTDNMFRRYVYDVKEYLRFPEQNTLKITFESAVKMAEQIYNNQIKNYTVYPKCVPASYNGECHVNHIRKMQASFSWDWGPALPGVGLWSVPKLIAVDKATILDTSTDVELLNATCWRVTTTFHLENGVSGQDSDNASDQEIRGEIRVAVVNADKEPYEAFTTLDVFDLKKCPKTFVKTLTLDIPTDKVKKWWPNGYGDQALYSHTVELTIPNRTESQSRMIGFRTVELVQEALSKGLSFYFKVNDVPIFAKGTNMIPISIMAYRNANTTVRELLVQYMRETHMNMVRIWGGGNYEIKEFYEAADKMGIMVWQDLMFACAMYPTTPEFLDSVKQEVRYAVWRLKSHPSVVIWAGNNENEAALYGNWYGTGNNEVYKTDYVKLYVNVIKKEVQEIDKTRPYLVSSPTNGDYSEKNGYVLTNPYSTLYGDIHYYNYVADGWNINTYKRARFSSEYGFQSLPSIKTLQPYCRNPDQDLVMDSDFIKHRQHLPTGNILMKNQIKYNLKIPNTGNARKDFESYIYLSQIHQAVAVQVQTESYRQARSTLNQVGEGNTMGALYWQLNDVWQAPSWSSIDYDGRWKMLHYYAESFFAPVIVSPRVTLDELTIFVISDLLIDIPNCQVEINVHNLGNRAMKHTKTLDGITVKGNSSVKITDLSIDQLITEASCGATVQKGKKNCIIELLIRDSSHKQLTRPNYVYPVPPKDMNLPACSASLNLIGESFDVPDRLRPFYKGYDVEVSSDCSQLFVWLDGNGYYEGRFTENGFHLFEQRKKIIFLKYRDLSYPNFRDITVTSLGSIYT